jgi:phage-related minor tail protein
MANDTTLEAVIRLRDEISRPLNDIQNEIRNLNRISNDANSAMRDIQRATGDTADSMSDLRSTMEDTSESLRNTNNAANEAASGIESLATLEAGQKMMEFGGKIIDVVKNLMELTEATKEFNSLQSKLQGSTKQNGYKQKDANKNAGQVYGYTGDDMMAVNVVSNLQKMGLSQSELDKTINASLAVWSAYGDSIPIEGLTESITETAQVSKVTGNLADALNWAGISEDSFNKKLEACKTVSEKNKLITDTLNQAYGKSKETYDKTNKSMIDYNKSLWESQKAQAELGSALAPLNSAINGIKSAFAEALAPVIKQIADAIQPVIQKFQEFIKEHPQLVAGITMVVAAITTLIGIIGAIIVVVTTVKLAFAGISAAIGIASGAFAALSAPILIAIGVIAAIIAIGVLLYKNWDTICAKATELKNWVVGKWNELKAAIAPIIEFIKALVIRKWTEMKASITFVLNIIKGIVIVAWNGIKTNITIVLTIIKTIVTTAWNAIKTTITVVSNTIKTVVTTIWNGIKTAISTIISTIKSIVVEKWNAIKNAIKNAMDAIKNTAINAFNNVKEKISGVISDIKSAWQGLKDKITNNPIVATVRKVTESLTGAEDGNHAAGLQRVPYNNYLANLHQGEAILPRRDADKWRQGKGNTPQIVNNFYGMTIREEADIEKVTSGIVRKLNEQKIIT